MDFLKLSICGKKFKFSKKTISKFPDSLFALLISHVQNTIRLPENAQSCIFFNDGELHVERSPVLFEHVVDFLCNGALHCPQSVCKEALKNELVFWRINEALLADCCWTDEDGVETENANPTKRGSKALNGPEGTRKPGARRGSSKLKLALRRMIDRPESSWPAKIFSILSVTFILLAVTSLIASTVPALQHCDIAPTFSDVFLPDPSENTTQINDNQTDLLANASAEIKSAQSPIRRKRAAGDKFSNGCEGGFVFDIIETVCVAWFTFELLTRFVCSKKKRTFFKKPLNVVDLLAIVPFYIDVIVFAAGVRRNDHIVGLLMILRILRMFRLANVIRLARHFESLQLMGRTLWSSRKEFGVLVMFLGFTMVIFSTVIYYCEKGVENTAFTSIPTAFWWAIVTLTTTGYGDVTPVTIQSRIVAGICCVAGIVVMAFPVTILVEHFHRLYTTHSKPAKDNSARVAIITPSNRICIVRRNASQIRKDSKTPPLTCKF